jgi:hypothetical protein
MTSQSIRAAGADNIFQHRRSQLANSREIGSFT